MKRITIGVLVVLPLVAASGLAQQSESSTKPGLISVSPVTTGGEPYKNYEFRMSFGGAYVAGFSELTQLGSESNAASGETKRSIAPAGVPVEVPGSLVGLAGKVTLLCSAAPGRKAGAGTVTLTCWPPPATTIPETRPATDAFADITLKRGISQDSDFAIWLSSGRSKERDLNVDVFDEAGQRTGGMRLTGCKVAKLQGLPSLDGTSNTVVIQLDLRCKSALSE